MQNISDLIKAKSVNMQKSIDVNVHIHIFE